MAAVNGDPTLQLFDPNIPPAFDFPYEVGPSVPGYLVSEFGISTASSFESMAPTLAPEHWGLHGGAPPDKCVGGFFRNCTGSNGLPTNVMAQRNYPSDSIIASYFGASVIPSLDDVGTVPFARQLYLAMTACMLQQKAHIEAFRSSPSWGTVIWQLAEDWPTTGWGSLEYGTADSSLTSGQVVGGRWKPLHHVLEAVLFRDIIVACSSDAACYVRNDAPLSGVSGNLTLQAMDVASGTPVGAPLSTTPVVLAPGGSSPSAVAWVCLDGAGSPYGACTPRAGVLASRGCTGNGSDCAVLATLHGSDGEVLAENLLFQAPPSGLAFARNATVTAVVGLPAADGSVPVTLTVAGGAALHVTLTTLAQGRFSRNALPLLAVGVHTTAFVPILTPAEGGLPIDASLLASSLRVEHLALYL